MLVPQSQESLRRGSELMEKYKDIPMDFADATLVVLAEEMGITESFTLDGKGFNAYRTSSPIPAIFLLDIRIFLRPFATFESLRNIFVILQPRH